MSSQELEKILARMRTARKTPDWLFALTAGAVKRAEEYETFLALLAYQNTQGWIARLGGEPIIVEPTGDIQVVARALLAGVVWANENNGMPIRLDIDDAVTVVKTDFPESSTRQSLAVAFCYLTFD